MPEEVKVDPTLNKDNSGEVEALKKQFSEKEEAWKKKETEFEETKRFAEGSSIVINAIANNPELRDRVKAHLKEAGLVAGGEESDDKSDKGGQKKDDAGTSDPETKKINERLSGIEGSQREQVINEFESKSGISTLKDEEKKEVRKQLESRLNRLGLSVKDAPLSTLPTVLSDAYLLMRADKLKDEGKMEGLKIARQNEGGVMGSFSGASIEEESDKGLSDKQAGWLKKLKVDPEKAKKIYLTRAEEKDRIPESEKAKK